MQENPCVKTYITLWCNCAHMFKLTTKKRNSDLQKLFHGNCNWNGRSIEIESQRLFTFQQMPTEKPNRWLVGSSNWKGREICSNEKKKFFSIDFYHSAFKKWAYFSNSFFFVKWFWSKKLTRSNLKCSREKFRNFWLSFQFLLIAKKFRELRE